MRFFILLALCTMLLTCTENTATKEEQAPEPQAVDKMEWWREAKFGMFIHWGLYAVPAGEYKGQKVKGIGEWIMNSLQIPIEDYEGFAAQFNPVKFNAEEWVAIAKNAGMKYIVITSKHHDGFCLWDSKVTEWDIMGASPFKRDILKELSVACEKEGIRLCFYHSIMDWHHMDAQGKFEPDYNRRATSDEAVPNEAFENNYYQNYLKPQIKELMTNYGDIGVMWFDGEWIKEYTTEMGKDLFNEIMNLDSDMIVNNRVDKGRQGMAGMNKEGNFAGDFGTPEQEIPDTGIEGMDWESCMTMNDTWGYKHFDDNWKTDETLIRNLIDIVSKGGNFLLNVGPTAEGLIPGPSVERLKAMGDWMKTNSESIYDAKASPFEKPEWGRYTKKDNKIYAHVFEWPSDGKLKISDTNLDPQKVYLLSDSEKGALPVQKKDNAVEISLPDEAPDAIASVVVIETK